MAVSANCALAQSMELVSMLRNKSFVIIFGFKYSLFGSVNHLRGNEVWLFALLGVFLEEVGKEEQLQHDEDDEQLDEDDGPQRAPQLHGTESVVVKVIDLVQKTAFFHPF